ncbi:MAG TPA: class I SAM-dependent methyltransferase [Proteobacteria bacterium]|nr:class I SAM-dependent methyltransferase [Pseudomonadota bacterium]
MRQTQKHAACRRLKENEAGGVITKALTLNVCTATRNKPVGVKQIISGDQFAHKYNYDHARNYYQKHHESWMRRISNRREQALARKALQLIGDPATILDLPCGAGRFWPLLAENQQRRIIAADSSPAMLEVASETCPAELITQIEQLHTSAYGIELEEASVDAIFSMRLLHHIGEAEKRRAILREFHRVTRRHVILSLWIDGNYKAWRRHRRDEAVLRRNPSRLQNRFIFKPENIEQEFHDAAFAIVAKFDFLPRYSMWRLYVLDKLPT